MADRVPIVVGGLAIVGIVTWIALRGDATPPAPPPRPAPAAPATVVPTPNGSTPDAAAWTGATPPAPAADPAADPATPATPPAQLAFEAEVRDDGWATTTEREIQARFAKLRRDTLRATECKTGQCRVLLVGTQDAVGDTIADLEGPRGMHGFAKTVLLTAPTQQPDGTVELRAFLSFER
ncbi:MAG: hypothetical protein M3680_04225 [Myxococcota bacterium]|nr:hypothetical protein [Myxococcota bacterium]